MTRQELYEKARSLPLLPGVYIIRDKDDEIIYIGKAKELRKRVSQYFKDGADHLPKVQKMVDNAFSFDVIVTNSEFEALTLECSQIKLHSPKYNILLKDDKTYPYIKITLNEEYPTIYTTRKILNDGAKYFGPYANSGSAKEMVDFIKQKFKIRQCRNFKSNKRVCLNYHIGRCLGPCVNNVSKEEYRKQIDEIIDFLNGKEINVIKKIKLEIEEASKKQEYEKAAYLRDKMLAIENISQKQKVSNINENAIDVIGIAKNSLTACIEVFFVRQSKMIGRENYFFNEDLEEKEILSEFVKQYYLTNENIPSKIMISEEIDDKEFAGLGANLKKNVPFASHAVKYEDTLDSLALKYYNNPTYWWIIAYFNDIHSGLEEYLSEEITNIYSHESVDIEYFYGYYSSLFSDRCYYKLFPYQITSFDALLADQTIEFKAIANVYLPDDTELDKEKCQELMDLIPYPKTHVVEFRLWRNGRYNVIERDENTGEVIVDFQE